VGTLQHATVYTFLHNLLNVLVQIANKMRLRKKTVVTMQSLQLFFVIPFNLQSVLVH
jgi:hypothetical protein